MKQVKQRKLKTTILTRLASYSQQCSDTNLSHPVLRTKEDV